MQNIRPKSPSGRYIETVTHGETVRAFVPFPLPPEPAVNILSLLSRLSAAQHALGRLDAITVLLPQPELFLYMYVRKEAILSSQIEGTQSSLSDLLRFETDINYGEPFDDIREVCNYVDAIMYGLERLKTLPLSLRLLREVHEPLLRDGRGAQKTPGEFRRSQNWLGGTRPGNAMFVPPPVVELDQCLDLFERFIHEAESGLPLLIKAGLLHVQFETIHPFLDGNGRIGRLLITLYLCDKKILRDPLLYLSLYFKERRGEYYRLLQDVRENGAWEAWLEFFLDGIAVTANQAFNAANKIHELFKIDHERIVAVNKRASASLRVHDALQLKPYITVKALVARVGMTAPTINAALAELCLIGIIEEVTGRLRGRVFCYRAYLEILNDAGLNDGTSQDAEASC